MVAFCSLFFPESCRCEVALLFPDSCRCRMTSGLELHEAASVGDYDTLEELIFSKKIDINLKDPEWRERTALHWACSKGTLLIYVPGNYEEYVYIPRNYFPLFCCGFFNFDISIRVLFHIFKKKLQMFY